MTAAVLDPSVFGAVEGGRRIDLANLPERGYLSAITVAELQAGVLAATDQGIRTARLETVARAHDLPVATQDADFQALADLDLLPILDV